MKKFRYNLTSITDKLHERRRCIGFARRRVGRGGRIILDRCSTAEDDEFWRTLDFTILENKQPEESRTISENVITNSDVGVKSDKYHSATANLQALQTEVKKEIGNSELLTNNSSVSELRTEIKAEPMDVCESEVPQFDAPCNIGPPPTPSKEEEQQMLEFLQTIRKDW